MLRIIIGFAAAFWLATGAAAERQSLFPLAGASAARPLIGGTTPTDAVLTAAPAPVIAAAAAPTSPSGSSLFSGRSEGGLFAPWPDRPPPVRSGRSVPFSGVDGSTPVAQLLSLIASAEAGSAGYDAVQHGARIRPQAPPTQMTLGEIYAWIDATPRQPHAIGRYQFIPSTLRRVARIRGFGPETPFTPEVQDSLALVLLEDAGLSAFQAGEMPRRTFMHNLARIWAGLPLPNGQSYYQGYAGNKATMTWARFEGTMAQIWPGYGG